MGTNFYSRREVRRLLAALGLFVAVPCLLLVFLAWQSVQILHAAAQTQLREVRRRELQEVGVAVHDRLRDLLARAEAALGRSAPSEMSFWRDVRQWMAAEPAVRAVVVLDADGHVAWPVRREWSEDSPRLSALHPAHPALEAARRAHWIDKDYPRARDHYRQVLTEPRLPPSVRLAVWAEVAACARRQGDWPGALEAGRRLLAEIPEVVPSPLAWLRAVELAVESGDDALARNWAQALLEDAARRGLDHDVRELEVMAQRLRLAWPAMPTELAEPLAQMEQATAARAAAEAFVRAHGNGPFRPGWVAAGKESIVAARTPPAHFLAIASASRPTGFQLALDLDWDLWRTAALEPALRGFIARHGGQITTIPAPAMPAAARLIQRLPAPLDVWAIAYRAEPVSTWAMLAATRSKTRAALLGLAIGLALLGLLVPWLYLRRSLRLAGLQADVMDRISHELKTPIASLAVLADQLRQRDPLREPATDREVRRLIHVEVQSLLRLNNRLLDYARQRIGPVPLVREPARLDELLAEIVAGLPGKTGLAPGRLECEMQAADYSGAFDREALGEILRNLVENAVKYAEGPARVRLALRRVGAEAVLEVADNGPGMAARVQRRLFTPYYRADSSLAARVPGLGLGLAIVKGLVAAHGGRIAVRSASPGGTAFSIHFPLGPAAGGSP